LAQGTLTGLSTTHCDFEQESGAPCRPSRRCSRARPQHDFRAGEKELMETIDVISRAIAIIQREMAKNPASFAQVDASNTQNLVSALSAIVDAASFSSADSKDSSPSSRRSRARRARSSARPRRPPTSPRARRSSGLAAKITKEGKVVERPTRSTWSGATTASSRRPSARPRASSRYLAKIESLTSSIATDDAELADFRAGEKEPMETIDVISRAIAIIQRE
jgi:soluble cytochrome b562